MERNHVITALVENKSGVLNRIASLFRRRQFNIHSLTVAPAETEGMSRMTITVDGTTRIDQVFRQMYRIVEVVKIKIASTDPSAIVRDLALVQLKNTAATKKKIEKIHHLHILEKNSKYLVAEIRGTPEEVEETIAALADVTELLSHAGATALCPFTPKK